MIGLGLSITQRAVLQMLGFSPASLFSAGEQGVWYDPSDMSTMFQDAAGTTPVTAVGQPVGRILDKSGRGNHATQTTTTSRPVLQQDSSGRYYLLFDGVDDWLVTPSIDFTSTDKMTVFAGVRKLSDGTGYGRIVDLAQSTPNRNNFILTAPWDPNTGSYGMQTNGSGASVQGYIASGFSAPISSVITSQHDIALSATTGAVRMRINKVEQNLQTTGSTTGGGTFTNNSLVIGKGAIINIFQLNARLYSLIVRGAQSTAQQIASAEAWVNSRTGAY